MANITNVERLSKNLDDLSLLLKKKHEQEIAILATQVRHLEERVAKLESGREGEGMLLIHNFLASYFEPAII